MDYNTLNANNSRISKTYQIIINKLWKITIQEEFNSIKQGLQEAIQFSKNQNTDVKLHKLSAIDIKKIHTITAKTLPHKKSLPRPKKPQNCVLICGFLENINH